VPVVLPIHIVAGSLGLLAGFIALASSKGAPLHRRAGRVFFAVMPAMAMSGGVLTVLHGTWQEVNLPAALITCYLVVTGFATVKPLPARLGFVNVAMMLLAFGVGLFCLALGFEAVAAGGRRGEIPAFPFFLFGAIGLMGGIGDLRMMRSGPPPGAPRIARHLWRMSMALWIAALSFFLGQADVIPEPVRIMPLLATPVVAVLVTMLYWLWRVRRPGRRRPVVTGAPEAV
jgi:hypothetical protein